LQVPNFLSGKTININKKNKTPINGDIKASEVMLIDQDGVKQGLISIADALANAEAKSLDLVQVSPKGSEPVVCKLLDYGKFLFGKKKNVSSKKRSKRNSAKEIKFRTTTDTGDYNIKLKKIKSFIIAGDKTKISVRFRGREILNSDIGLELLKKVRDELDDIAQVDQEPSLEGRQLLMVLSPIRKKN
tara:strand:+ start:6626 stop:7189 length:564 start_codon:yes stop_codon:yes gene_type:complete